MDSEYLKRQLGTCLVECLTEVSEKRPHDPIEYMAQWLYKHIENVNYKNQCASNIEELKRQEIEYELEQEHLVKMKEEQARLAAEEAEKKRLEEEARKAQEAIGLPTLKEDGEEEGEGPAEEGEGQKAEGDAGETEQQQATEPTEDTEQTPQEPAQDEAQAEAEPEQNTQEEEDKPPEQEEQAAE